MVTTMTTTVEVQGVKKATMMISDGGDSAPASGHYAEEFDFSDVFGPVPAAHLSLQLPQLTEDGNCSANWYPENQGDPIVVYSRSHSLVGPFPILTCQRSKLIWDEIGHVPFTEESEHTSSSSKDVVEAEVNNILSAVSGLELSDSGSELEVETPKTDVAADESPHSVGVERLGPQDFELLRVVGQGAFGRVFQVQKKGTTEIYAMKVMRKDKIMERNHGDYMKAERDILTKVVHPFIVQLQYSFQTRTKLYLVLDFINGGHLFFQLYRQGTFSEDLARMYCAEIICAVAHLHKNGIIHRDLKPENILLDSEGHVRLTDFGLAKEVDDSSPSNSLCGTMEYMAPEILLAKGHGKAADWWSVGILLYEMVTGQPPFAHSNKQKLQQKIIKDKIKLPSYLTSEANLFLKGLLQKDASRRLGSGPNGSDELKQQKWFKSINWHKLEAREIVPKFIPAVSGKHCTANFDEIWTNLPIDDSPASTPKAGDCNYFRGYTYVAPNAWLD
ncbi:unnamed protein product [Sphagnum tenellum]